MGLIFITDEPPRLDSESENLARGFATARVLADHQDEFKRHYSEQYERLLQEETENLRSSNDVAIELSDDEARNLYAAWANKTMQAAARDLWTSRGHGAPDNATFEVKKQEHWAHWMLSMRATP
jgi:hypothetical protein